MFVFRKFNYRNVFFFIRKYSVEPKILWVTVFFRLIEEEDTCLVLEALIIETYFLCMSHLHFIQ